MLFKDINQQANEILEGSLSTLDNKEKVILKNKNKKKEQKSKKRGKFDTLKAIGADVADTLGKAGNAAFDATMNDGKKSSKESKKIKDAVANGASRWDIEKNSALDAIAGKPRNQKSNIKDQENSETDNKDQENTPAPTKYEKGDNVTLTTKDQVRLEKNIFSQDDKKKRTIFKSLVQLYNDLTDKKPNKKVKTEAFDFLSIDRKLLSDQELIRILDYIYSAQRRNKEKVKESIILEDTIKKIKNNVVSKEWKKRGSKRDKDNLVKLMRVFKLSDIQIFTAFEKIGKDLTYDELRRLKIDIKHANMPVTKQDLEKLVHTLGKFKLKQFLIKLKNSIKK